MVWLCPPLRPARWRTFRIRVNMARRCFMTLLVGFTTFSAFGNETINLWRDGENGLAVTNIAAHIVLCLGAVWLSRTVAYEIWR